MDYVTLFGLVLGIGAVFLAVTIEGGTFRSVLSLPAFITVFGGTAGATAIGYSFGELKNVPALIRVAFRNERFDTDELVATLVRYAEQARRNGLLALEDEIMLVEDAFFRRGMQLVIDGADAEVVRDIMETEITFMQDRHRRFASIFEAAGGYAPTLGIIGTVMGLVNVLGNLSNTDQLGPSIATAFIATFYGVASANLIFLPLAAKLKSLSAKQLWMHELTLEGILSIQAGDNPRIVLEKLQAYLAPKYRPTEG